MGVTFADEFEQAHARESKVAGALCSGLICATSGKTLFEARVKSDLRDIDEAPVRDVVSTSSPTRPEYPESGRNVALRRTTRWVILDA